MPLALRLAGCWLLWSAWCSVSGWILSAVNQLDGWGHLALLPILLAAIGFWLKTTAFAQNDFSNFLKWRRRWLRPLPLIYLTIAGLSLLAALANANPWSFVPRPTACRAFSIGGRRITGIGLAHSITGSITAASVLNGRCCRSSNSRTATGFFFC